MLSVCLLLIKKKCFIQYQVLAVFIQKIFLLRKTREKRRRGEGKAPEIRSLWLFYTQPAHGQPPAGSNVADFRINVPLSCVSTTKQQVMLKYQAMRKAYYK